MVGIALALFPAVFHRSTDQPTNQPNLHGYNDIITLQKSNSSQPILIPFIQIRRVVIQYKRQDKTRQGTTTIANIGYLYTNTFTNHTHTHTLTAIKITLFEVFVLFLC